MIPGLILGGVLVVGAIVWMIARQDKHVTAGRHLYGYYCSHCHGPKGQGDGYNAQHLDPQPRDLTDRSESYMAELTHAQIAEAIEKGGRGIEITPLMPAFGRTLSENEVWALSAYVRTLHQYKGEPLIVAATLKTARPTFPPIERREFTALFEVEMKAKGAEGRLIEEGQRLVGDYGCDGCHRINGRGGTVGPDLSRAGFRLQPQYIYRWTRNPQAMKPHTRMPNLGVSDHEALAITLYLGTLKTGPKATTP